MRIKTWPSSSTGVKTLGTDNSYYQAAGWVGWLGLMSNVTGTGSRYVSEPPTADNRKVKHPPRNNSNSLSGF